jgi:hypothetical protein
MKWMRNTVLVEEFTELTSMQLSTATRGSDERRHAAAVPIAT